MTKTFKQLREINLNTALLKPRADQIRKQATAGKWDAQDKKDFETAAKFLDKGDLKGFNKFIHTLDSFPRDEILHSAGLWNTKLPESMSYVGQNVSQKLSYDNWLKKVKGIEKGAHGIKGDEHTKLSKQWRDYRGKDKLAASYEQVEEVYTVQVTKTNGGQFVHGSFKTPEEAQKWIDWYKTGNLSKMKAIKIIKEELNEGYEGHIIAHLGELGIDTRFSYGTLVVKKADLARVKDALKDGASDRGSLIYGRKIPAIHTEGIELEEGRMKELHTLIQQGKSAEEIAKIMKLDVKTVKSLMPKEEVNEVSPPGWGGSVKAMKKHADIDNPYALAWHMKNKGDKPHYKDKDGTPVKKDKYKDEQMEQVTEKLDVKWDKDKEGWFDKQGKRRYLGKGATNTLMHKAIDKAKASGDWIKPFDLQHGQKPEEKEIDMKEEHDCAKVHPDKPHQEWAKDNLKKAQYENIELGEGSLNSTQIQNIKKLWNDPEKKTANGSRLA